MDKKSRNLNLLCGPQQACWTRREDPARPPDSTDSSVSTSEDTAENGAQARTKAGVSPGDTSGSHKFHQAGSEVPVLNWDTDSRLKGGVTEA